MIQPITKRALILVLLVQNSVPAYADLQQEMDGMFGTMTNFTAPTAHLGQRRGVITGGSLVARNGITNTNLISFVPPHSAPVAAASIYLAAASVSSTSTSLCSYFVTLPAMLLVMRSNSP